MGSPLSPTFDDFSVADLKNKIMNDNNSFNSQFFIRYVDDSLVVFLKKEKYSGLYY